MADLTPQKAAKSSGGRGRPAGEVLGELAVETTPSGVLQGRGEPETAAEPGRPPRLHPSPTNARPPERTAASMTDLATLTEAEFWPLIEQARDRVLTNDVDALEALIVGGLPPDEMQAAAWALVQRVRGLRADLMRVQRGLVEARNV